MSAHVPVLLNEVVAALSPRNGAIYVDGTFGGGGYSEALLTRADCTVYGIDRDPDAIARGSMLAQRYAPRLTLIHGRFSEMLTLLHARGVERADGVALDIGVSSYQFDEAERGFSFREDALLDMRMDRSEGRSAADLVNSLPEAELADIIWRYGEEKRSRAIARAIVAARPVTRTGELAAICENVLGKGGRIHAATRTFQALRIAVNDELGELERGLDAAERVLADEGRLAVVSFHSLEDRIAKRFFTERSGRAAHGSRHAPDSPAKRAPTFRLIGKQPTVPAAAETAANPRARSARLRAAIRTDAPVMNAAFADGGRA